MCREDSGVVCLVVQGCSGVPPRPPRACISLSGSHEEARDATDPALHSGERASDRDAGFGAASRGQGFDSVLGQAV